MRKKKGGIKTTKQHNNLHHAVVIQKGSVKHRLSASFETKPLNQRQQKIHKPNSNSESLVQFSR